MGWQGSSDTGDQDWRQGPRVEFNIFRETGLRDPAHQLIIQLDDGWPESEKHVFQAALSMVVVKKIR